MTEIAQKCAWCGVSLPCSCGYNKPELGRLNWGKIGEVFGDEGIPSCGMTDAELLNSDGQNPKTIFIGKTKKDS